MIMYKYNIIFISYILHVYMYLLSINTTHKCNHNTELKRLHTWGWVWNGEAEGMYSGGTGRKKRMKRDELLYQLKS